MYQHQIDKTAMYQATHLILTAPANQSIYGGHAAFVRGQITHAGCLNILSALARSQGTLLTGITMDQDRLQISVINRTLIVAGAAGAYALENQNQTLAAKFDVSLTDLSSLRASQLDDTAQLIHDEAEALVNEDAIKMAEHHLIPVMLTGLQSAIAAYSVVVGTPRAAIASRTTITEAIANEIERADGNLENLLDRLIPQFQADHPAFVTAYQSARKIVHTGRRKGGEPEALPVPVG